MPFSKMQVDPARRAEIGRERRARTRAKIIAAAFELFGDEAGLYGGIEDVAGKADLTRATIYNHFSSMAELREALTFEVTHDFLAAVTRTISNMPDAADRSACAVRFYLHRARTDRRWGWSMINLSANGFIFGAETFRQAGLTIQEGVDAGVFALPSAQVGRDLLLGATLAAMGSIVRGDPPEDYPETVAGYILFGMGVPIEKARRCASQILPPLDADLEKG